MFPTPPASPSALIRAAFVLLVVLLPLASQILPNDPNAPWLGIVAVLFAIGGLVAARSALGTASPARRGSGARLVERMLALLFEAGDAYLDGDGRITVDTTPDPAGGTTYTITIRAPQLTPAVAAAIRTRSDELAGWPASARPPGQE